ncbi:MAG: tRNA lysidine(34) synthetase TilS [Clostridia bacterium]|nr:tRNA lysidine(34) synthetase TilS [Clostridia bacterium]
MMQANLCDKVFDFTQKNTLISSPSTVVVGVSGGADSMALLHLLHTWPQQELRVCAVHVHHGLRGDEADRDEMLVRDYCARYAIPLEVIRADVRAVAREKRCGLEEAGRLVRYDAFERVRARYDADYIATAHTASDAAETMLMHIVRGCGVGGLTAIPPKRGRVIRPLLCCTRQEVEGYCAANAVPFITDSTNADTAFLRNRVRHELLPLLRDLNPSIESALLRLRDSAVQDEAVWQEMAQDALAQPNADGSYARVCFLEQLPSVRMRMWKLLLARHGCHSYTERHLESLEATLLANRGTVYLPNDRYVTVSADRIKCFVASAEENFGVATVPSLPMSVVLDGREHVLQVLSLEETATFQKVHKLFFKYVADYDKIRGGLYVRCRCDADAFHPAGRRVGKTLKKLFQELRVPIYHRDSYPLLCDNDGIVLIPGIGCDDRVRPDDRTKHFLVWTVNGEPCYTLHYLLGDTSNCRGSTEFKE